MIELTDVAYVRSGVADLDKAVAFATEIVGLELVTFAERAAACPASEPRSVRPRQRTGGTTALR